VALVLLHGFTQTGRSFGPLIDRLAADREVRITDLPGHGTRPDLRLDLWGAARWVLQLGEADYLGYSMGGRIALHAALIDPVRVQRLILVGATAGIADSQARSDRRAADEALADRIERDGVPVFLENWLSQPLFAGLPRDAADIADRLTNTASGLAAALRLLGTGTQEPLDDRLRELTMPVLLVVGEQDEKFRAEAERLQRGIGHGDVELIAGAGHACHLEQPDAFCEVVEHWLTATPPGPRPSSPRAQADGTPSP
jgi:2-succinyl-6-hydroxy-2,4-cyclohexadiene-1-carboxylate synthase